MNITCSECEGSFSRFPSEMNLANNYCSWSCTKSAWVKRRVMGVYTITHRDSGKVYVGSSELVSRRWDGHRHLLRRREHPNVYLQRAWQKYGEEAFDWAVIEVISDKDDLLAAEQKWIDKLDALNPSQGFNLAPVAGNMSGFKHSQETKLKIGRAQVGRKHSPETIRKMKSWTGSSRSVSKLTEKDVAIIKLRLSKGETQRVISEDYGVARSTIGEIARGTNWAQVTVSSGVSKPDP